MLILELLLTLRVLTLRLGYKPTAGPSNFFVHAGEAETIAIGRVNSQQVVGIETGAVTTVSFPEGVIGSPFAVGDSVSL